MAGRLEDRPDGTRGGVLENISTTCVIAGGGPAGMMCGFLLARGAAERAKLA